MHRTTAVTIFGALNVVFSVFMLFRVFNDVLLQFALPFFSNDSKSPFLSLLGSPTYAFWLKCMIPLKVLSFVLLLTTGIGLLRFAAWARALSIAYGIYSIIVEIAAAVIDFIFFYHPFIAQTTPATANDAAAATIAAAVGLGVGGVFRMVYATALISFMTRSKTIANFLRTPLPSGQTAASRIQS